MSGNNNADSIRYEPGASIAPVDGAADFASIPYEDNENGVADFAPRRKQDGASADFAAVKGNGHEKRDAGFAAERNEDGAADFAVGGGNQAIIEKSEKNDIVVNLSQHETKVKKKDSAYTRNKTMIWIGAGVGLLVVVAAILIYLFVSPSSNTSKTSASDSGRLSNSNSTTTSPSFSTTTSQSGPLQTSYMVSTLAGIASSQGGSQNGQGTSASFNNPYSVAVDSNGNVYVADTENHLIRKIISSGLVSTLAGTGSSGSANGQGTAASFNRPFGVAVDSSSGNVYVADTNNHIIRKISSAGDVSTLAGSAGFSGSFDGQNTIAGFNSPSGVAVDSNGNVYVADNGNHLIRKISLLGFVSTLAGTIGISGANDGLGPAASFLFPFGIAVDSTGNVYVADFGNKLIRKITSLGLVSTLAGSSSVSGYVDGQGSAARFYDPHGVALDSNGIVYVADSGNHLIRMITPSGIVSTLAGTANTMGSKNGQALSSEFYYPRSVAVDASGNVYVADTFNYLIRKVSLSIA